MLKITFDNDEYHQKLSAELPSDASLEEIFDVIKGMLVSLTYNADKIEEYLK